VDWRVPLTEIELPEADVEAVLETLRGGWLTMGPRTIELEEAFAEYTDSGNAVAVSSGTAALHLACLAVGVGPGDEVIAPAMSYVASANVVRHCGATVVFCDSTAAGDPNLDPGDVAARITPRTKAVIAVHIFGYPARIAALREVCEERDLILIEDAAHAAGARIEPEGGRAGTAGRCGCFSFFSKTQLGTGEGGMVVTDDDRLADRVRSLRSHAMTSGTWDRHRGHAATYDVTDLGFNYRIDETRATLVIRRLGRLDEALEALRRVVRSYRDKLVGTDGVELPFTDREVDSSANFAFPIMLEDRDARDALRARLRERGIQTSAYPLLSHLAAYRGAASNGSLANAAEFADRHCVLPLFPTLSEDRVSLVASEVRAALLQ
jgi:dTDP-4-amino-4,6-dideoxygalactose transaminase